MVIFLLVKLLKIKYMNLEIFIKSLSELELSELKSLLKTIDNKKTSIPDFCKKNSQMSTTLKNSLIDINYRSDIFIEDLKKDDFLRYRNCGLKKWIEFTEYRGF
jgi:serine protease inhibitor